MMPKIRPSWTRPCSRSTAARTRRGSAPTHPGGQPRDRRPPRRPRAFRCTAMSAASGQPVPVPMMNILNGGAPCRQRIDFQEFMVMPVGAPNLCRGAALRAEIFHALKGRCTQGAWHSSWRRRRLCAEHSVGPGGARLYWASRGRRLQARQRRADRARLRLDEFFKDGAYEMEGRDGASPPREMADYLTELAGAYPIASIEDGMAEDDMAGWKALTEKLGGQGSAGRRRSVRDQ